MAENEPTNFPQDALKRTKVEYPKGKDQEPALTSIAFFIAGVSSRIQPWGTHYKLRDKQLRDFWPTEPYLSGAFFSGAVRNANFQWEIEGPNDRIVNMATDMFNGAIAGANFGWLPFVTAWSQDWYGQDNGAFMELIRDPGMDVASRFKRENAPVIGIAHLDSAACLRTGDPLNPVVYTDRNQKDHLLKWYEVVPLAEFSSPLQDMNGVGYCAISRILKMAEIIHSIEVYTDEKVSGRFAKDLHIVSGVNITELEDAQKLHEEALDNKGLNRYATSPIISTLDPEKPVSSTTIPLASIPDNFDFDVLMRWYISVVALGFGMDYQDLAPLPTGNIGSGEQSEILHRKSRGKGPANFMETFQNVIRDYGIIPKGYTFRFLEKDLAEEAEQAKMMDEKVESIVKLRRADIINGTAARAKAVHSDVLEEFIAAMVDEDFGNEPALGRTNNMIGQVGGSTTGEDAKRTDTVSNG